MLLLSTCHWTRDLLTAFKNRDGFRRGVRGGAGLPPPDRMFGFLTKIFQFFSMYFWSLDHIFPIFLYVFLVIWPYFSNFPQYIFGHLTTFSNFFNVDIPPQNPGSTLLHQVPPVFVFNSTTIVFNNTNTKWPHLNRAGNKHLVYMF